MHEVIPGARVEGAGSMIRYLRLIDPVGARRAIGMVFQRPNPFPAMSIRNNVVAGLKLQGVRNHQGARRYGRIPRCAAQTCGTGSRIDWINPAADCLGAAAAVVHRTGNRRATRRVADGRALLSLDPISTMAIEDYSQRLKQQYTIVIVTITCSRLPLSDQTAFFNLEAVQESRGRL